MPGVALERKNKEASGIPPPGQITATPTHPRPTPAPSSSEQHRPPLSRKPLGRLSVAILVAGHQAGRLRVRGGPAGSGGRRASLRLEVGVCQRPR